MAEFVRTPDGVGRVLDRSRGHYPQVLAKGNHFEGWYPESAVTSSTLPYEEDWFEYEDSVEFYTESGEHVQGYIQSWGEHFLAVVIYGGGRSVERQFDDYQTSGEWVNYTITSYLQTGTPTEPDWAEAEEERTLSVSESRREDAFEINRLRNSHNKNAAWADVMAKAKRMRAEGKINVLSFHPEYIKATVQGDSSTYDVEISRGLGDQTHVDHWNCTCRWGEWAFKREHTYIGRMCSHALAVYHEMMALTYHYNVEKRNSTVEVKAPLTPEEDYLEWAAAEGENPEDDEAYQRYLGDKAPQIKGGMLRVAGKNYSLAEQQELINEMGVARHLPLLNLSGTHYEELEDGVFFF